MQWSVCLKEKLFSCSPNTQSIFILFDLQCFFKNVNLQTERLHIKCGLLASVDQRELGDTGTALLHDSYQPFIWGTWGSFPLLSLTWLVTVLSLKKQAPKIKSSSEIVQKREHLKMIPNILWYIRARHPRNASHVLCSGPPKSHPSQ